MKMVSKIFAFAAALTIASFVATAQEKRATKNPVEPFNPEFNEARDENGKIQRNSYITNPWYDNWTFGVASGYQTQMGQKLVAKVNPVIDVYVIKWFTPVIATRFGYTGFNGYEAYKDGFAYSIGNIGDHSFWYDDASKQYEDLRYNRHQFHFDVMWNIINTFWGYQYNRVWTVSPYLSGGYMRLYPAGDKWSTGRHDNEMYAGVGLYNAFRITNHFNITLDLRSNFYSGRYHWKEGGVVTNLVGTIGVSYTIHKWYWNRVRPIEKARDAARADAKANAAKADAARADAKANAAKADAALQDAQRIQKDLDAAKAQIDQLKADAPRDGYVLVSEEEFAKRVAASDMVVYYLINKSDILPTEQKHLDEYVTSTLARDPRHVFYLTGSADKGTGTEVINARLSHDRAAGVKAVMMKKYNIPEGQVIIKATIISDLHEDPSYDRCVLIESK